MIYENHFSLNQRPFTIAPNPEFLYASGQYQEALAALQYGMLHRGGFVLLTGEVGTGKTTLCKHLLSHIPENTEVALILHPQLDRLEMLQLICREFGIGFKQSDREVNLIESLTEFLLSVYSKGGYSVLIIDEAQHLDVQVLELIRLLTNLETHQDKLLQIIMLGQPELRDRLNQYDLRQLNQRFTARYHLNPLNKSQLGAYIQHRIHVAGGVGSPFTTLGLLMLHRLSGGIPRLINVIADRSLMGGYATGKKAVGPWIVFNAAKEVIPKKPTLIGWFKGLVSVGVLLVVVMLSSTYFSFTNLKGGSELILSSSPFNIFNSSPTLKDCSQLKDCWQGGLPMALLKGASNISPLKLNELEVSVNINGAWHNWNDLPMTFQSSGMVEARIKHLISSPGKALKVGDIHQSISQTRDILDRWDHVSGLVVGGDTSQWQVIKPQGQQESKPFYQEALYDLLLEGRVKNFQQKFGLIVDGVIGSQTLISLKLLSHSLEGQ